MILNAIKNRLEAGLVYHTM